MKNIGYKESIEICEEALDMLDVKSFLIKDAEPHQIMDAIDLYVYENPDETTNKVNKFMREHPEVFGEDERWGIEVFNYMTMDEFMEYCKKRFPEIRWDYEFIERYWVR